MTRYNHAFDVAYELVNESEDGTATVEEHLSALRARLAQLEADHGEAGEALMHSLPFDTYKIEEES